MGVDWAAAHFAMKEESVKTAAGMSIAATARPVLEAGETSPYPIVVRVMMASAFVGVRGGGLSSVRASESAARAAGRRGWPWLERAGRTIDRVDEGPAGRLGALAQVGEAVRAAVRVGVLDLAH